MELNSNMETIGTQLRLLFKHMEKFPFYIKGYFKVK
ncbi:hypothetical protein TUN_06430 [Bacillus sp. M21]|nr:hypothetical protein TUN_06430 [Bacillus sp. M21]